MLKERISHLSDPDLLAELEKEGRELRFKNGEFLMEPGRFLTEVPIVLEGAIKVLRMDESGKEVFLYYLQPGQTCALSLTCCAAQKPSEVKAVAEGDTSVWMVPVQLHDQWTNKYKQWKEFVALTYQSRFQEMLKVVDDIAFKKMDQRLLQYLLNKFRQNPGTEILTTHQEIATELGTSREVVSRLLKQMEKKKIIELGRNKIYVRDDFEEIAAERF